MKTSMDKSSKTQIKNSKEQTWLIYILLIVLFTIAVRYRLIDIPLERDERGFAYCAQLILHGIPPYTEAYDYNPPGLYFLYASAITIFGSNVEAVHLLLLIFSAGTSIMLFWLVKKWSNTTGGAIASILSIFLLASSSVLGFAAHATHFVMFWAMMGYLLLEIGLERRNNLIVLASGISFGLSFLMKQSGFLFLFPALFFILANTKGVKFKGSIKSTGFMLAGFIIPLGGIAFWLMSIGALKGFIYWNIQYPWLIAQGSGTNDYFLRIGRNGLQAAGNFLPVWITGLVSLIYLVSRKSGIGANKKILIFIIFSLGAVSIGYETRSHYFVLLIPALAAAIGIATSDISKSVKSGFGRKAIIGIPIAIALFGAIEERDYFFFDKPEAISRSIYYPNLFADAEIVSEFIRSRSDDSDRVAILGSEPEILFLSQRRSATRYIFTDFINMKHELGGLMQKEMIREIDSVKPAIIVMINQPFSWGALPSGSWPLLRWIKGYLENNYEIVGTVTQRSVNSSVFRWDQESRDDHGALASSIIIFQRIRSDFESKP
ncbi:MAG: hypothetical protein C0417_10730 [Chlorobiaceae bacterium]|nr:hypothetical protein [Chlorobiaceae bacterium]